MRRTGLLLVAVFALLTSTLGAMTSGTAAHAAGSSPDVVGAVPAAWTPWIQSSGSEVLAITQVGNTMVVGGSFTQVSPPNATQTTTSNYILAFDATTGAISQTFKPQLNGEVDSLLPGPGGSTVYVGGNFSSVGGHPSSRVAQLSVSTGQPVTTFNAAQFNGEVNSVKLADGLLWVGGYFNKVDNIAHGGLATLDPTSGKLSSVMNVQLAGHHGTGKNHTSVGVRAMDVTPDGSRLIVIGNFTTASGLSRQQVVMVDISNTSAAVDQTWSTADYTPQCFNNAFDSTVRGVAFSPDGSYLAITATGGYNGGTLCDATARFETHALGANLHPTWVDFTGGDTPWSVAITNTAIYVGGHFRWENNSTAGDQAGEGAVPRPGITALDPVNGMPLTWNPGRNPRGAGAYSLYIGTAGLWVGSDTDWIGNRKYHRDQIAFFPQNQGYNVPSTSTGSLPGTVYLAGNQNNSSNNVSTISFDGSHAATAQPTNNGGVGWAATRGAFMLGSTLYYGQTDGALYKRTFDGSTYGPATQLDPYHDPVWDGVYTGSGGQNYDGVDSSFYSEIPNVAGMFYSGGRIYYTKSGSSALYYRYFEADSGVTGSDEFTASGGLNWSNVGGMFINGSTLYFVNVSTGALWSVPFQNGSPTGTPKDVNDPATGGDDWRASSVFIGPAPAANQPPVASFTATCPSLTCTFDGSSSHDPDGSIASYSWNFGDGQTGTGVTPSHTYAQGGTYSVTLTVTDNNKATNQASHTVYPANPTASPISFVGAAGSDANTAKPSVTIPSGVAAGNTLLLFATVNSSTNTPSSPSGSGWTALPTTDAKGMTTRAWWKTAAATDAGSKVTVPFGSTGQVSVQVAAYAGTSPSQPIDQFASAVNLAASSSHTTPTVQAEPGDWAVSYWSDKSSSTTQWTPPSGVTQRDVEYGSGTGRITALLAGSGGPVNGGSYGNFTATTNQAGAKATMLTIALGAPR